MGVAAQVEHQEQLSGGVRLLLGDEAQVRDAYDVHALIEAGIPAEAVTALVDDVALLHDQEALHKALGMSERTLQRWRARPRRLTPEQSNRAWRFAEVLGRTEAVFGSREAAERWLSTRATALNRHRPIDLLSTQVGFELVNDLLTRINHGVYT